MTESFQGSGTESIDVNFDWSKPGTHLKRGSTRTSGDATGRRSPRPGPSALAQAERDPPDLVAV